MIYTFRTRRELIKHLRALCELSCSIEHCKFPLNDFESDLSELMHDLTCIRLMYNKFSSKSKIYIAFRTTGFESSTIFHHFKSRVTAFQTSLLACYSITFSDGYYNLNQISLN